MSADSERRLRSSVWQPFAPRIAVVGAGAVGGYYGARLAEHGNEVHFLMRSDLETVRANGLKIHSAEAGDLHLPAVNCHGSSEAIGAVDLVIIALKSTNNDALETLLPPLLHEQTALLTLQNGLGNEAYLGARFGAGRVMGGLCFVCLNRVAPGEIRHIGHGLVSLGEFIGGPRDRTRALHEALLGCGVPCSLEDNLTEARWRKLVWNVPFNGLAIAAGGIDVAKILADAGLIARSRRLMREIIDGAAALGLEIEADYADIMIDNTRSMGAYRPSSLIDFQKGREVEIEAIWGEPLRQANARGIDLPELAVLYREITEACARQKGGRGV